MKTIGIIGLGRFGRLLKEIFDTDCKVLAFDPNQKESDPVDAVLKQQIIFIATPIHLFESVIDDIAEKLKPETTMVDVCSVKVYPVKVMKDKLPKTVDIIATHPLFGPDSFHSDHPKKIMMANIRDQYCCYEKLKKLFEKKGLIIEEMTPEQHDRFMALSQGITHLIGRTLAEMPAHSTPINTAGFEKLLQIMEHTCNDSWDLFFDLQRYNPYSQQENQKMLHCLQQLIDKINKEKS